MNVTHDSIKPLYKKNSRWEDNSFIGRRGRKDPSNITSFSVTSHEPFSCDAKLQRDDSRLKDTRCIGTVPLASRRVSFQARWRSQYRASKKGVRKRTGDAGARRWWREEEVEKREETDQKTGVWWNRRARWWRDTAKWRREREEPPGN